MGFYDKFILPPLLDLVMRNKDLTRLRATQIPKARGTVLEIGIGSGLNLPFYTSAAQRIIGVDPSLELQRRARKRADENNRAVEFLSQPADATIPLPDTSVDTVISTWTLCTISDPVAALREMKRVLRPGGTFLFIEHGHSPDSRVATWQDRLTPAWKKIAGGCTLNRKIEEVVQSGGFHISDLETKYLPGPRPMTHTYIGVAQ